MTESPDQPTQPLLNQDHTSNSSPAQVSQKKDRKSPYLFALLTYILGIFSGVLLFLTYPRFANKPAPATPSLTPSVIPTTKPTLKSSPSADLTITPETSISATPLWINGQKPSTVQTEPLDR